MIKRIPLKSSSSYKNEGSFARLQGWLQNLLQFFGSLLIGQWIASQNYIYNLRQEDPHVSQWPLNSSSPEFVYPSKVSQREPKFPYSSQYSQQTNKSTNKTSQRPLLPFPMYLSLAWQTTGQANLSGPPVLAIPPDGALYISYPLIYHPNQGSYDSFTWFWFLPSTFPVTADGKRKRTFTPHRTHLSASCYYGWTWSWLPDCQGSSPVPSTVSMTMAPLGLCTYFPETRLQLSSQPLIISRQLSRGAFIAQKRL